MTSVGRALELGLALTMLVAGIGGEDPPQGRL